MDLPEWEKAIWVGITGVIATLAAVVRGSDIQRIQAIEKRHADFEAEMRLKQDRTFEAINQIRIDMDRKHLHLVGLITGKNFND